MALRIQDWQVLVPISIFCLFLQATAWLLKVEHVVFLWRIFPFDARWAFWLAIIVNGLALYIFWVWRDVKNAPSGGV